MSAAPPITLEGLLNHFQATRRNHFEDIRPVSFHSSQFAYRKKGLPRQPPAFNFVFAMKSKLFLIVSTATLAGLTGCDQVGQDAQKAVEKTGDAVEATAEGTAAVAEGAWDATKETAKGVQEVAETTYSAAQDTAEGVKSVAEGTWSGVQDTAAGVKDVTEGMWEGTKDAVKATGEAVETVGQDLQKAAE